MDKQASRREALSRVEIVRAALALLEERGTMAEVSMRVLANEFDVWPNALYQYFRDKNELMSFMLDEVLSGHSAPPKDLALQRRILEFSLDFRRRLAPYPDLAAFLLTGRGLTDRVRSINSETVEVFLDAGWTPDAAVRAFASTRLYVLGSLLIAQQRRDTAERRRRVVEPTPLGTDGQVMASLAALHPDDVFSLGLSCLLDGLAAALGPKT